MIKINMDSAYLYGLPRLGWSYCIVFEKCMLHRFYPNLVYDVLKYFMSLSVIM
jgi:hypothetical protein